MAQLDEELGAAWRDARGTAGVVHVDHAACSRPGARVLTAVADHARVEAEIGGYIAEESAAPLIDAGRTGLGALMGMSGDEVHFVESADLALLRLLLAWQLPPGSVVAAAPGEYGTNLTSFAARGLTVVPLRVDALGRVDPDGVADLLRVQRVEFVHLTLLGSHRGVVQPGRDVAQVCAAADVPLVVDAAQALGHVNVDFGADAVYSTSRKWLSGPRGVGVLAVRTPLAARLPGPPGLDAHEAHVAGRVGLALAVEEHLAHGAQRVRLALAAMGTHTRDVLDGVGGWRVVEPRDEPSALTTLAPPEAVDVAATRARLHERHGILTTYVGVDRAPFELIGPVLRVSPHVGATAEDLDYLASALGGSAR